MIAEQLKVGFQGDSKPLAAFEITTNSWWVRVRERDMGWDSEL